jgi:Radical SAM superfamily
MPTLVAASPTKSASNTAAKARLKQDLYAELKLKLSLQIEGIHYSDRVAQKLAEIDFLHKYEIQNINLNGATRRDTFPKPVYLKHGFCFNFRYEENSLYEVVENDGIFGISRRGEYLADVTLGEEPDWYYKKFPDGTIYRDIARASSHGVPDKSLITAYSEECSAKANGETCLFCSYNSKVRREGEDEWQQRWKHPGQIAQVVKEAYDQGYSHFTLTGGFVPERRELDYYIDVAEAIKEKLGRDDFNGTACIGAPLDLRIIEKYKEAGFSSISFNTEVWGKEWFNVFNPVKVTACGGFDNWVKAIEYAVKVFGPGNVRSNFVIGLQPKDITFQGIDYLASIGVVTVASSFIPTIGSPLEGHRSPTAEWHWDAQLKHAQILRKYGRTYEEIFNATPGRNFSHDIFQIEDETWHSFAELEVESLLN